MAMPCCRMFLLLGTLILVLALLAVPSYGQWAPLFATADPQQPAAPTNLRAVVTSQTTVMLTWDDRATNERGYVVERKAPGGTFQRVWWLMAGVTSVIDGPLSAAPYVYRVWCWNDGGSSPMSNEAEASFPVAGVLAPPSDLVAVAGPEGAFLAWRDNSDGEDGFKVELRKAPGIYSTIVGTPPDYLGCSTGLLRPGTYSLRVRAYNAAGQSAYSNEVVVTVTGLPANVIYVKHDAAGAIDGTSWANAYRNLQDALQAASAGKEIWVAAGTYKPTAIVAPGSTDARDKAFQLKDGVAVYGGFKGRETQRIERDWLTNETILSGDIGIVGDGRDNCYHVVNNAGLSLGRSAVLDGFTIRGGWAGHLTDQTRGLGGGMFNAGSSPTLRNLVFADNYAGLGGGGMYNVDGSPSLSDVAFVRNNTSGEGGGLDNYRGNPVLTNVSFLGNFAETGGGMWSQSGSPRLRNTVFSCNFGRYGGGLGIQGYTGTEYGVPAVVNATIVSNRASSGGGVLLADTPASFVNCIIWGNTAGATDGQIAVSGGETPYFNCCTVQDGWPGTAMASADPAFVRPPAFGDAQWDTPDDDYGDLHLTAGSPCIDSGTTLPYSIPEAAAYGCIADAGGARRLMGASVDRGAYELQKGVPFAASGFAGGRQATPEAPVGLMAVSRLPGQVTLAWTDAADNEEGFAIERRDEGLVDFRQIAVVRPNPNQSGRVGFSFRTGGGNEVGLVTQRYLTFDDEALVPGITYCYRVRALNGAGQSPYSNEVEVAARSSASGPTDIWLRINQARYLVNGQTRPMDVAPVLHEERTFLPVRYVAEPLGAMVMWDGAEDQVAVIQGKRVLELWIGSPIASVNGVLKAIDPNNDQVRPFILPPGRTMLPLRFISEQLDCSVEWIQITGEVRVQYPAVLP